MTTRRRGGGKRLTVRRAEADLDDFDARDVRVNALQDRAADLFDRMDVEFIRV